MTLSIDIVHRLGNFELNVRFETDGRLTALFGPSGSGKTSIVNLIAGLARPDRGQIVMDGTIFVDRARNIFVGSHRRRIGYVFQDAKLFPHMTVRQNLRYGQWFSPRGERYADEDHIVEILGIGALLERRPGRLSGGEKQRVAIGRALLSSPRLLLMDEPLASLDDRRKAEILPYIVYLRDQMDVPVIYVSHAADEVRQLADQVVLLDKGRVMATGDPGELLEDRPGERLHHAQWKETAMPSLSLRINLDPDGRLGPGKIALLEQIAAQGSISAAARVLGMSYKRGWDLVEDMNRLFGKPLVVARPGGRHGGGATLTDLGLSVVSHFRAIETQARDAAKAEIGKLQAEIDRA